MGLNPTHGSTAGATAGEAEPEQAEWPEPELIRNELLPVAPIHEEMIPEPLRPWLVDVAQRMQCPVDFVATAAIVLVSSIVGTACGIRPKQLDDWLVVPNLWGGVVARPSMLKSPAIAEGLRPLARLEAAAKDKFENGSREREADFASFKAKREAIKQDMVQAAKGKPSRGKVLDEDLLRRQFADLEEPSSTTLRRYKTNDSTIEKMAELLRDNPRGLMLFRDELVFNCIS